MYEFMSNGEVRFPTFDITHILRTEILKNIRSPEYAAYREMNQNQNRPNHPNYTISCKVVDENSTNVIQDTIRLNNIPSNLYYILTYGFFGESELYVDENNTLCVIVKDVCSEWQGTIEDMLGDLVDDDNIEEFFLQQYNTNVDDYLQYMIDDEVHLISYEGESESLLVPASPSSVEYYCNNIIQAVEDMIIHETRRKLDFIQVNRAPAGGNGDRHPKFHHAPLLQFIFIK